MKRATFDLGLTHNFFFLQCFQQGYYSGHFGIPPIPCKFGFAKQLNPLFWYITLKCHCCVYCLGLCNTVVWGLLLGMRLVMDLMLVVRDLCCMHERSVCNRGFKKKGQL